MRSAILQSLTTGEFLLFVSEETFRIVAVGLIISEEEQHWMHPFRRYLKYSSGVLSAFHVFSPE